MTPPAEKYHFRVGEHNRDRWWRYSEARKQGYRLEFEAKPLDEDEEEDFRESEWAERVGFDPLPTND